MELSGKHSHKYSVLVDDSFHHMDPRERYCLGEFDDCLDAVAACKELVDNYLRQAYKPSMATAQLWRSYTMFGDDPFIVRNHVHDEQDEQCRCSAWDYAKQRCKELCDEQQSARASERPQEAGDREG